MAGKGGRVPGSKNKRAVIHVADKLEELGVDLVKDIIEDIDALCAKGEIEAAARLRVKLLEYCAPKKKSITITEKPYQAETVDDSNVQPIWSKLHAATHGDKLKVVNGN